MEVKTSQKIVDYIANKGQATGNELAGYLGITTRAVRKQLNGLLEEGRLYKIGRPPKVFYLVSKEEKPEEKYHIIKQQ